MAEKYDFIKQTFNLCSTPQKADDIMWIADEVSGAFGNMAMGNFPYAANFIGDLPANPIN